jgi:quercetin dioxygenase-like cupin family protein
MVQEDHASLCKSCQTRFKYINQQIANGGRPMATARTKTSRQPPGGHESIEGTLSRPLLQFDLTSELGQLHHDESWLQAAGRSSKTLVKHPDLRIVLIAMKANTHMHEHTAAAKISVHTLSGHIRLHLPEQVVELPVGHLLALDECMPHDVEATEDSAFLLTLSWPPETKNEESKTHRK